MVKLVATPESFRLRQPFTISRGTRTRAEVVTVRASEGGVLGMAECTPYARYGESVASVLDQIASVPGNISRAELQDFLPAGAARNAVDCALWDLQAKRNGVPVWQLAGFAAPQPVETAVTVPLGSASAMAARARELAHLPVLKIKLGGAGDLERLEAVHRAAPTAHLIVDANEGWTEKDYLEIVPQLSELGVALVEQPFPADADTPLARLPRPVPVCADESLHTRADLARMAELYNAVNIKLDKTGGLTEAFALLADARRQGLLVMVGCMLGTSLAMAPAILLAQGADFVDLDGPLLLAEDRVQRLTISGARIEPPAAGLWG